MLHKLISVIVLSSIASAMANSPNFIKSHTTWHRRIIDALCCHDCDGIPKVANAGRQFYDRNENCHYQVMHNGIKVVTDDYNRAWRECIVQRLRGHYNPREEYVFCEAIKNVPPNSVMLELGGNGYYSMWFRKTVPGAVNFLVESSLEVFNDVTKRNFTLNEMDIKSVWAFVANTKGLYPSPQVFLEHLGFQPGTPIMTVDELVARENIPFIWMLCSNIGGMEYQMLLGCKQTLLQKKIGYFFISTHSQGLHIQCRNMLKEMNFILFAEYPPSNDATCDGLLAAHASHIAGPDNLRVSGRVIAF